MNTKARLPYSKIEEFGIQIKGLPSGASLKHPSSYGKRVLQGILDQRENLTLYGTVRLKVYGIPHGDPPEAL